MRSYIYLIGALFFVTSCADDSPTTNTNDPSNLTVTTLAYDDGSGIVAVSASADNAIEYRYYMGDEENEEIINSTGSLEHTYKNAGNYTIEVRAYGQSGRFMKVIKKVFVPGEEPISIGEGYSTPISYDDYELVWNDEFSGTLLDQSIWSFDNGDGCPNLCGWGNNELEWYRPENSEISNGALTITAKEEFYSGRNYTSTKLVTRNKQAVHFGRVDVRAVMPKGQGLWPAIWLLGTNQPSVGWPKCGEIDIMEMVGGNNKESRVNANLFWDDNGQRDDSKGYMIPEGLLSDKYHVYSIIWTEQKITFMIDDHPYHSSDITSAAKSEFQKPFYMILNVAVGGNWPGSPDETTSFPTSMSVDYVRVFKPK